MPKVPPALPAPRPDGAVGQAISAARQHMFSGSPLRDDVFAERHRLITRVLGALGVFLLVVGIARNHANAHLCAEVSIGIGLPLALSTAVASRRLQSIVTSVGLMIGCALFVHLTDGLAEAHFLFFVLLPLVALYRDWITFAAAVAFVLAHHGMAGTLDPSAVFSSPTSQARPVLWAFVHALFVAALIAVLVVHWRASEAEERRLTAALAKLRHTQDRLIQAQQILTREATTDSLSGLTNRSAFRSQLELMLLRRDRPLGKQAVLFVDLDDFKDVNDTLGHAAGDAMLQAVAERLRSSVRPGDIVARLGGDEFAILLDGLSGPEQALTIAERIVVALSGPVQIGDALAHVGASVGLAACGDESAVDEVMRQADVAMYAAKGKGKNRVESYDPDVHEAVAASQHLRSEIASASRRNELLIQYQPIADLTTGSVPGMEALVRWQHPTHGLLAPPSFIALAESTGAVINIGTWVLETAMKDLRAWQIRYERPHLWMSVNVSARQLEEPDFVDLVLRVLEAADLSPASLVLEVTETMLVDPHGSAAASLATLRHAGVRIALDDFGGGYATMGHLRQLPVDMLKIDRSFVSGPDAEFTSALLEAIVNVAHGLNLTIIPVGIEAADQLARLHELGCRLGQGYLLARPQKAEDIAELLANRIPLAHLQPGDEFASLKV